jgi:hypothetical protein
MFDSNHQNGLYNSQSSFMQPALAPVGDLLGLGNMDSRVFGSNHQGQIQGPMPAPSNTQGADKKKPAVPPPKPPKRILPQSTGSSNSSAVSQSLKPPVPKKPTRLTDPAAPRWIAPRPLAPAVTPLVPLIPANAGKDLYYGGKPSNTVNTTNASRTGGDGNGHGTATSVPAPPPPYTPSGATLGVNGPVNGTGRTFKTLQPQSTLYGMGTLVNTLGVEQQVHPVSESEPITYASSERNEVDIHEHALYYLHCKFCRLLACLWTFVLSMFIFITLYLVINLRYFLSFVVNPQLYDPLPPNNRRRLL